MHCLFCKIVNGDIPSMKIYEDSDTLAFLDINPDCDGHTLIIPKKHFTDLDDIDTDTLKSINIATKVVKKLLEEKLNCDGVSILQNNGIVQEIKHYHVHLKPQYKDKISIELVKHKEYISNVEEIFTKIKGSN